jgi:hypothetical protein
MLRPGELLVARGSEGGWRFRLIRLGDDCTPVSPKGLWHRLLLAGLQPLELSAVAGLVQIRADRPFEPGLLGSTQARAVERTSADGGEG